jgi:phage terminase large subunit GpA-like protein
MPCPPNVDDEGDPIELAVARTSTFARSKICMGSTPTVTGRSRIDIAFEDQGAAPVFCGVLRSVTYCS